MLYRKTHLRFLVLVVLISVGPFCAVEARHGHQYRQDKRKYSNETSLLHTALLNVNTSEKNKCFLHVGPHKTGSTTLLLSATLALDLAAAAQLTV